MATVAYIRSAKEKNLLFLGISEKGESVAYRVDRAVYHSIGMPCVGDEIDHTQMEEIINYDNRYRAKKKALNLLSYADNNKKNLYLKLVRAGFSKEVSMECTEEMVALGYIDEQRTLVRLILAEAKKLRGPKRITLSLLQKGYSQKDIKLVMEELVAKGELDFSQIKEKLLEEKLGENDDISERKKLLQKHGF